jgi:hypothetical protein
MNQTIEIKHRAMTTVASTEVSLPFYFTCGTYVRHYCCMTAEMKLISLKVHGNYISLDVCTYDDMDDVANRLSLDFNDAMFSIIDEAVFMYQFSRLHRELLCIVNSNLGQNE